MPVAEADLDTEDVSIRIDAQAVPRLREVAVREVAQEQELAARSKPSKRQKIRGVEETYRSAGKGAKELFEANVFFQEAAAADPVDAVTDWMDGVEVRRGKSYKALKATKKGQTILEELASGSSAKGVLDVLTWILTQNRSKRWDQVDWALVRSFAEALADPWERNRDTSTGQDFQSAGGMEFFPAASGQDPLAEVLGSLAPKVEQAAIVAGNLSQLELVLDEVREAFDAARRCMTKENRAVIRRRIKALEKLAAEPWKIEQLSVCDPQDETRLCGLGAIHQEAAEIMRACGDEYQPLWPVVEARELLAKAGGQELSYRAERDLERLAPVARQAAAQELARPARQPLELAAREDEPEPEGELLTLAELERARIPFPDEAPGQFALTLADAQAAVPFPTDDEAEAELIEELEPLDLWEPQERPPLAQPDPLVLVAQPSQVSHTALRGPVPRRPPPPSASAPPEIWKSSPVGIYTISQRGSEFALELSGRSTLPELVGVYKTAAAARKAAGISYRDKRTALHPERRAWVPVGIWGETEEDWRTRYSAANAKLQAKIDARLREHILTWDERGKPSDERFQADAQGNPTAQGGTSYGIDHRRQGYGLTYISPPGAGAMERARRAGADIPASELMLGADGLAIREGESPWIATYAQAKAGATKHLKRLAEPTPADAFTAAGGGVAGYLAELKAQEKAPPAPRPKAYQPRWVAYARSQGNAPEEQAKIGAGEGNWAAQAWIRAGVLEWQESHPAAYRAGLNSNGEPSDELNDEIDAWLMEKAEREAMHNAPQPSLFAELQQEKQEEQEAAELMQPEQGETTTVQVWRPAYAQVGVGLKGQGVNPNAYLSALPAKLMGEVAAAIEGGNQNPSIGELPGARTYKGSLSGATLGTLTRHGLIAKAGPGEVLGEGLYGLTDKGRKYIAAGWREEQRRTPLTESQQIRETARTLDDPLQRRGGVFYVWAIIEPTSIDQRDLLGGWIKGLEFPWRVRALDGHIMVKAPANETRARSLEAMAELAEDLDRMGIKYRHNTNHVGQLDTGDWFKAPDFEAEERAGFFQDPEQAMRRNTAEGFRESIPRERWRTNNRRLWIVSCGKDKTAGKAKAGDLYTGPLFRAQYALARKMAKLQIGEEHPKEDPHVAILSAKHGLVSEGCELEPYNQTMGKKDKREREVWGREVWRQIGARLDGAIRGAQVVVFASKSYIDPWRDYAENAGVTIIEPLARLTMGNRRKELKRLIEMPKAEALAAIEGAAGGPPRTGVRKSRPTLAQPEPAELAQPPRVPTLAEEEEARAELLKIRAANVAADKAEINANRLGDLYEKMGKLERERQRAMDALDRADTGEKRDRAEARLRKATERHAALEIKASALDPGSQRQELAQPAPRDASTERANARWNESRRRQEVTLGTREWEPLPEVYKKIAGELARLKRERPGTYYTENQIAPAGAVMLGFDQPAADEARRYLDRMVQDNLAVQSGSGFRLKTSAD